MGTESRSDDVGTDADRARAADASDGPVVTEAVHELRVGPHQRRYACPRTHRG
ncbi:hypothetical protein ACFQE1_04695 [Halobium palmae]|uniref:Uncharacterized protein n=1 Tax=Halobium palmae TaxID=1776492 RepID=A0ABD5RWQ1_9EURY